MTRTRIAIAGLGAVPAVLFDFLAREPARPLWQVVDGTQPCAQADPDAWHPEKGAPSKPATSICNGDGTSARPLCPFAAVCLQWGLHHERSGIWGGVNENRRRELRQTLGISTTEPGVSLRVQSYSTDHNAVSLRARRANLAARRAAA